MMDKFEETQLNNKIQYVNKSADKIRHHLRNSIELELLMQLEDEGLGHWTISQLLNYLQEMNANGETESFYALEGRKKPVNQLESTSTDSGHKLTFISNKKVLISNVEKEESNDKIMQSFVSMYPNFIGEVTVMKKDGEFKITETISNKYDRQYIYEIEEGKYRKHRYSNPLAWKDCNGKRLI